MRRIIINIQNVSYDYALRFVRDCLKDKGCSVFADGTEVWIRETKKGTKVFDVIKSKKS